MRYLKVGTLVHVIPGKEKEQFSNVKPGIYRIRKNDKIDLPYNLSLERICHWVDHNMIIPIHLRIGDELILVEKNIPDLHLSRKRIYKVIGLIDDESEKSIAVLNNKCKLVWVPDGELAIPPIFLAGK